MNTWSHPLHLSHRIHAHSTTTHARMEVWRVTHTCLQSHCGALAPKGLPRSLVFSQELWNLLLLLQIVLPISKPLLSLRWISLISIPQSSHAVPLSTPQNTQAPGLLSSPSPEAPPPDPLLEFPSLPLRCPVPQAPILTSPRCPIPSLTCLPPAPSHKNRVTSSPALLGGCSSSQQPRHSQTPGLPSKETGSKRPNCSRTLTNRARTTSTATISSPSRFMVGLGHGPHQLRLRHTGSPPHTSSPSGSPA